MFKKTVPDFVACLFVVLFAYAATNKIYDYEKFVIDIGKSPLLTAYSDWVSLGVIIIEIALCALLSVDRLRLIGLYCSYCLMVTFSSYIVYMLNLGDFVPCSCGGILQSMTWEQHLTFNVAFCVMGVAGVLLFDT